MIRTSIAAAALFSMLLTLVATPALAAPLKETEQKVQAIADPIIDNILQAMKKGDYGAFTRDFERGLKQKLDSTLFESRREEYKKKIGEYGSRTYLGSLDQGGMTVILWKSRFSGTDDDVLLKLFLSKEGDRILVKGFHINPSF